MRELELGVAVAQGLEEEVERSGLVILVVVAQARQRNDPPKLSQTMHYQSQLIYMTLQPEVVCPACRVPAGGA